MFLSLIKNTFERKIFWQNCSSFPVLANLQKLDLFDISMIYI